MIMLRKAKVVRLTKEARKAKAAALLAAAGRANMRARMLKQAARRYR